MFISFEHNQSQPNVKIDKQVSADDRPRPLKTRAGTPGGAERRVKYCDRLIDRPSIWNFVNSNALEIREMSAQGKPNKIQYCIPK